MSVCPPGTEVNRPKSIFVVSARQLRLWNVNRGHDHRRLYLGTQSQRAGAGIARKDGTSTPIAQDARTPVFIDDPVDKPNSVVERSFI